VLSLSWWRGLGPVFFLKKQNGYCCGGWLPGLCILKRIIPKPEVCSNFPSLFSILFRTRLYSNHNLTNVLSDKNSPEKSSSPARHYYTGAGKQKSSYRNAFMWTSYFVLGRFLPTTTISLILPSPKNWKYTIQSRYLKSAFTDQQRPSYEGL